jgi:hypothetical protein
VPEYGEYFNPMLQALKSLGSSATIDELNARIAQDMKLVHPHFHVQRTLSTSVLL